MEDYYTVILFCPLELEGQTERKVCMTTAGNRTAIQ